MGSFAQTALLVLLVHSQITVQEPLAHQTGDERAAVDKLVEKLLDQGQLSQHERSELEDAVIAKPSYPVARAHMLPRPLAPLNAVPSSAKSPNPEPVDPFASVNRRPLASAPAKPVGFLRHGVEKSTLLSTSEAARLLRRFDREQREGPQERGSPACTYPALRACCRSLAANSMRVMMGICAHNVSMGVAILDAWVNDLGLPQGKIYVGPVEGTCRRRRAMEVKWGTVYVKQQRDGAVKYNPLTQLTGAVYVKYNSDTGDAYMTAYDGEVRGVLFTPELDDGNFHQFAYLPLELPSAGGISPS
eukprot:gnl/TRDRNA2_/TRDRNA2_83676_c0_seq1.p1 gnl/TRDRNA2_/TRDRNA2_83676_c0~~gnl/TRDRNA2_/TRDRNA2_83676_c0_seq1.p1  ORF type:complete len:303 (-),score=43.82 gnl/TRDRNA2_/TRDRNA2_83676_c0_seq1:113-1021(-)